MTHTCQYVSFYCGERLYGLDIQAVSEVTPAPEIVPVPRSQAHIRGLVNLRGQVILVLDLAMICAETRQHVPPDPHIVIFKTRQELQAMSSLAPHLDPIDFAERREGILVDAIGDVVEVPTARIEAVSEQIDRATMRFVRGLVNLKKDLLTILDIHTFLRRCGEQEQSATQE